MHKIAIIGAGNVATHLATHLHNAGHTITQVMSKHLLNAKKLAQNINGEAISSVAQLNTQVDFILISIKDDVVTDVSQKIMATKAIIAHTSGSAGINAVGSHSAYGVFYPLQTFSKTKTVDIKSVPFFIEGNTSATQDALTQLANSISNKVLPVKSDQLKSIHLAAVFACNFSNHMFTIAHDILRKENIDLAVLAPLVQETIDKAFQGQGTPLKAQTGPAARNDLKIMQSQLAKLPENGRSKEIYELVSKSIIEHLNIQQNV